MRLVTTTVAVDASCGRVCRCVHTPVPGQVKAICKHLRSMRVTAPVASGAIIWVDDRGPGIEIVASRAMPAR